MRNCKGDHVRLHLCLPVSLASALLMNAACDLGLQEPTVLTLSSSPLGSSAVTVNGSIHPHGLHTTYYFEYGTTSAYGSRTTSRSLPPQLAAYYHESWDEGFGGWITWGSNDGHFRTGGYKGGHIRVSQPSRFYDFNHEMVGVLRLVMGFRPGPVDWPNAFLSGGDPDFRDARVSICVRGNDWRANGSELAFFAQNQAHIRLLPYSSFQRAFWGYTGFTLTDFLADGQWHPVEWRLHNDASRWTFGASNPALHGRRKWPYRPIDSVLAHVNVSFSPVLAFVDVENPPTGSIDFDEFQIAYRNESLVFPGNGGNLVSWPSDSPDDPATLTDGWRHGEGRMWRSGEHPSAPPEFVYSFQNPIVIDAVQLHQNPTWPTKNVEVLASKDGISYTGIMNQVLPEKGDPNANFAFALQTGLSSRATFLKVRLTSGYRKSYWGLGEIEIFGTGAIMAPDDDVYHVNTDLDNLVPDTTYHYRLVARNTHGTSYGRGEIFTVPATRQPYVITRSASRITGSSAKVEGRINPLGLPTYFYFEYGTDTRYGLKSPLTYGGLEVTCRTVLANLSGLREATLYHYRLVAINGDGKSYGHALTFKTGEEP